MLEIIREIFTSPAGSFGFVFGLLVLAFWACYYVTKFSTKINSEHGHFKENVNGIKENVDEIRRDLSFLKGSIDVLMKNNSDGLTQRNSPISLTEKGKELVEKEQLDVIVNRNWSNIMSRMEVDLKSRNPYDIQQYCVETASVDLGSFLRPDDVEIIKKYAYLNGLSLMSYTNILGVLIRDRYFKEKNIDISEVDKNDPNSK